MTLRIAPPLRGIGLALGLGMAGLVSTGCSAIWNSITSPSDWIAGSSRSISDSIETISDTISGSSGSGGSSLADERYRRDVRAFAATFVGAGGGSTEDFLRGIGRVAERHGLSDWEAEPATLVAIGEGLRDAGVDAAGMEHLRSTLEGVDPEHVSLLMEGWEGAAASGS